MPLRTGIRWEGVFEQRIQDVTGQKLCIRGENVSGKVCEVLFQEEKHPGDVVFGTLLVFKTIPRFGEKGALF